MDVKKLAEVFKTVGLPPYTYVKPEHFGEVMADVNQSGKHLLIEGPSGIGKTCVVFKVFEELQWTEGIEYQYLTCRDIAAEKSIQGFLDTSMSKSPSSEPTILVIDDFHLLPKDRRSEIGGNLKRISDQTFERKNPAKVILIGIPTAGDSLLTEALDLGPRLGSYRFSRATDEDIARLITEGEDALNILFEDQETLLSESAGNFWLAQYICNKICATQEIFETQPDTLILTFDLLKIRQRLMAELNQRYQPVAKAIAKGKKWRPGGNKPYLEVLLALSRIPESTATFDRLLTLVPENRRPGIRAIRYRISEVIHDPTKNIDWRKQISFGAEEGFSIEDPLFRYYLSNLDIPEFLKNLGIESDSVQSSPAFAYDIGFSFAGEARVLVEAVNEELKVEDVVTFYDYDQQAVLLAHDLQESLAKIYAQSCRYFLVFLDHNYKKKFWTRFEQDILTGSGRANHIIPVILDDEGAHGVVGIPSTLGRIDLRSPWATIRSSGGIDEDARKIVRNRCVLPILSKIDASSLSL